MPTPCVACYQAGRYAPAFWVIQWSDRAVLRGYGGWFGYPLCNAHAREVDTVPFVQEVTS